MHIQGLRFTLLKKQSNMKHNIYGFSLFLKILCFVSKESLNIPEYRCLLIGPLQYLYTIEQADENIAYFSW